MSAIKPAKTADFLRNMSLPSAEAPPPPEKMPVPPSRAGRKHIGAYLDRETVEKVAVLRARLGLDNSELIKLAVEDLYRKQTARRAFGDT